MARKVLPEKPGPLVLRGLPGWPVLLVHKDLPG